MADQLYYENESYLDNEDEKSEVLEVEKSGSSIQKCPNKFTPMGSICRLTAAIRKGKIKEVRNILDEAPDCINRSDGGQSLLHLACYTKELDILKLLLERGAETSIPDSYGNFALHTAVREKWYDGIKELLQQGASPDELSQPPEDGGGIRETALHTAVKMGDIASIMLLLAHRPSLSIKDGNDDTVFHLAAASRNLIVLKELLQHEDFEIYVEPAEKDGYTIFHAALSGKLGTHNENSTLKVLQSIYNHHRNLDQANVLGETPLIKACQLGYPKIVKFFLEKGANPKQVTCTGESTIHAACSAGCSKTLNHLLNTNLVADLVVSPDRDGHPPFHRAIDSSSFECCKILLENGENLTHVYKNGKSNCALAIEQLPSAMQLLRDLFDSGITLSETHKNYKDLKITFDYSILMSSQEIQCSIISQLIDTPLENLIKHPLLESFLNIKWYRIRKSFYLSVFNFFVYLLFHTCFVMITFGPEPKDWTTEKELLIVYQTFHVSLIIFIAVPGALIFFANLKVNLLQLETYTKIAFLIISIVTAGLVSGKIEDDVAKKSDHITEISTERIFASMSMVLGWTELMMLVGRFPTLGSYILMFSKVGKSIVKFLFAFLSLLIGFSLGFHILFQAKEIFANYNLSFVKTLTMMTGGLIFKELAVEKGSPPGLYCLVFMSFFLFMVTIIMSNLLIGLAVNDIPELKRQGKLRKLVKQASFLMAMERLLFYTQKFKFFPKGIQSFLRSQLSIESKLTVLPNKEFRKNKYLQTVPAEIMKEAIALGTCGSKKDFPLDDDEDISDQFKSFRIKYSSDHVNQRNEFKDIADTVINIQNQVDTIRSITNSQMSRVSEQIEKQNKNFQDLLNQLIKNQS
ncbi:transient receptor potential channel pyrexia-like isoform X2 [Palaemon carinicauda]